MTVNPLSGRALKCLLALAILYTLYFAKSLLLPMVVALLFALLLSPLVGVFKRFHVPRFVSALILLLAIGIPLGLLGAQLAEPAKKWLQLLPELSVSISEQLQDFGEALQPEPVEVEPEPESRWARVIGFFSDDEEASVVSPSLVDDSALSLGLAQGGLEVLMSMLAAAPGVVAQFVVGVILALFLLVFGPRLYESFVEVMLQPKDRRRATLVVARVQQELSRYILTVSVINCALGIVTAAVLWLLGVEDALLWGALVGLLNFAPYVGPLIGICVLTLAGTVQYGLVLEALMPALVYFSINLVESQFITPTVLGRRMQLNPLVVMVWLIIWGWLWGGGGVLLAVPLLVCIKLAAEQMGALTRWVRLVETGA